MAGTAAGRVEEVALADLRAIRGGRWNFAEQRAADIARHFEERRQKNPRFFNGRVYVCRRLEIAGGTCRAEFVESDFASFLYWRDHGLADPDALDCFGSALVLSGEGHLLLGRQSAGHLNSGIAYPPGGFIDARDVARNGSIDIEGSIARELAEETGLHVEAARRDPGFLIARAGALCSIGMVLRFPEAAADLAQRVAAHAMCEAEPELAGVVIVRSAAELGTFATQPYVAALVRHLLPAA